MPYKDPEIRRMKHRGYSRKYRAKHREERNSACRAYHAAHREEIHARKRAYNLAHKAEIRAHNVAYYAAHKEERKAAIRAWCAANPDRVAGYRRRSLARIRMRKIIDAAYYAHCHARYRVWYAKQRLLSGLPYRPLFHRRIPNWATMGRVLDCRSAFLAVNLTPSQRAYARELAIERKKCFSNH